MRLMFMGVVGVLAAGQMPASSPDIPRFRDVKGLHKAAQAVTELQQRGIFVGYAYDQSTPGNAWKSLCQALENGDTGGIKALTTPPFFTNHRLSESADQRRFIKISGGWIEDHGWYSAIEITALPHTITATSAVYKHRRHTLSFVKEGGVWRCSGLY